MPQENQKTYINILNEIIKKQSIVLGPNIAVLKAKSIPGLTINAQGTVVSISGNEEKILKQLIDAYIDLSGQIVKNLLNPIFAKYPKINIL